MSALFVYFCHMVSKSNSNIEVTNEPMVNQQHDISSCKHRIAAVQDAMYALGGKWKISIVASLSFGAKRYSELLSEVTGISGKMLSRELKEMESNQLVKRTVLPTQPITVCYELTEYGHQLGQVIESLAVWGLAHRKRIMT